jgi:DNA (cytosine-5)-methyltransferase 1
MFRKADDRKSNLILTILSFIDFIRPKFVIFENVRGFLQYNLNAIQVGIHRTRGGIKMGGLKFVEAALIKLGYVISGPVRKSSLPSVQLPS